MEELIAANEWIEMRNKIRRVVQSLEVCWKCQRVCECQKHVLGQTVLVWFCKECWREMDKPSPDRPKNRVRALAQNVRGASGGAE